MHSASSGSKLSLLVTIQKILLRATYSRDWASFIRTMSSIRPPGSSIRRTCLRKLDRALIATDSGAPRVLVDDSPCGPASQDDGHRRGHRDLLRVAHVGLHR